MQKPSILYVDDELVNLFLFEEIFKEHFKIVTASSGKDGLSLLEESPNIDVVISDMRMPGMDGLEFISEAREKFSVATYFICTGFSLNEEINEALTSGLINGYFPKPYDVDKIAEAINNASN